ncbi:MAG: tetratricopeptide repeat protein [Puniceicoccales bacterium]|jgi:outer membrane protein assembly factor BamD|nr:tetratricopeptide repeat protein [Puniceicoccales bacterium]
MKIGKCVLCLLSLVACLATAMADLSWTAEAGWQPTSDVAAEFNGAPKEALELMNVARLAQEKNQHTAALSKYKQLCKQFPDTIFAPEAYYQTGKIKLSRSQFSDAFKAFNTITKKYPEYPRFNDVLHEEFEIARLVKSGERPKYLGIIPGLKNDQAAIDFYEKVVEDAPFSDMAPLALVHISEIAMNKNKIPKVISTLERLIDEYPLSEYVPEAYLKLGEIYANMIKSPLYDQGAAKLAMNYYEDFLILYPNHERAQEAQENYKAAKLRLAESKLLIGDFYFNIRNNPKAANIMYRRAAKLFPDSDVAVIAHEKIQYINDGNLPEKTPIDFLFGRYERPNEEQMLDDDSGSGEDDFDFQSDFIRLNSTGGSQPRKFSDPDELPPSESFLRIGPEKQF